MTISFHDQVAIITGAGRGLGREYALDIARRGGTVVVVDIGRDAETGRSWADSVVAEIEGDGGRAVAVDHSVSTSAGGAAIVDAAMDSFGRVDVVIHNAGFLRPAYFEDLSDTAIDEVFGVHVMGAFNVGRPAWRHMQKQGYGRIVLTSSGAVLGYHASANYAAAKAALLGLNTALATEGVKHGIRVNAILPFAQSSIGKDNPIPESSIGLLMAKLQANADRWQPSSISPMVTYLASSACSVTGRAYSAVAGRYALVAQAVADGWLSLPDLPSAEDVRDHLAEIEDLGKMTVPASMIEEMGEVLDRL